jgi:predicted transcriptional regulator
MSLSRINVYLERDHDKRLADLCAKRGLSRSSVVAAALASFLSPEGADRREAAIARRLDKLTSQFERLSRDQTILIETIALFVRYQLSVNAPVPESHQDAARAQGKARFQQFIEQLARHLQRGGSLVKDLSDEIYPSDAQFYGDAPVTGRQSPEAS